MTFALPKKTQLLWQMRIVFAFALLCAAVAFFSRYTLWFLLPAAIIATLGLGFAFVYMPFYFKSYKITVDENSISITKGVIIKTIQIMPFPRLVFAQSFTTPLSAVMKMKCVMLKAARGWMLIPEIENVNADYLLDNLRVKPND
ncbi:MAG: hypothetical protein IJY79_05260 [Clostridia bacterium]|nr:hypothetical protein [Clostridia bacterium]